VEELCQAIQEQLGVEKGRLELKFGYPPSVLDLSLPSDTKVSSLGLKNREKLILTEVEIPMPSGSCKTAAAYWKHKVVPPDSVGGLERLVIPADNSCLFNAVRTALQLTDKLSPMDLRLIVKERILSEPEQWSAFCQALTEKDASEYAEYIMQADSWGGALETQILADYFGVQICSLSIQRVAENPPCPEEPTGEGRIFLIYDDGVHYDVLMTQEAVNVAGKSGCFSVHDEAARQKAHGVVQELNAKKEYTDSKGCSLQCMVCHEKFVGFKEAAMHGQQTGHQNIVQIQ